MAIKGHLCHEAVEHAWAEAGVVSSQKKRVSAAERVNELGAEIDGQAMVLGGGTDKLLRLIQGTPWLLNQRIISRKALQIMAGRWVFALQFRRPAMAILQATWKFIGGMGRITHTN